MVIVRPLRSQLTRRRAFALSRRRRRSKGSSTAGSVTLYREAILAAAGRVIARRGTADTDMAAIAREAGLAKASLQDYFQSKEDILRALEERSEAFLHHLAQAHRADGSRERLGALIAMVVAYSETQRSMHAMSAPPRRSAGMLRVDAGTARLCGRYVEIMEDALRACMRDGSLRSDIPVRVQVQWLTGILIGLDAHGSTGDYYGQRDRVPLVLDIIFRGLERHP